MFEYFGLLFKGIVSKKYWTDRWNTFLELLNPVEFYSNIGKKDWDTNAYLLGLTISLVNTVIASFMLGGFLSLFIGATGLAAIALSLVIGIAAWFVGALVFYYIIAWLFAIAAKAITKRNDIEKIRPILFSLSPVGLAGLIPFAGGLVSLILMIVLLVIAYEKALKLGRGQAVGGALLGALYSGLVLVVVAFMASTLLLGSILSGDDSSKNILAYAKAVNAQQEKIKASIQLPDSWGIFESLHNRSDAQKQKDATEVIVKILEGDVKSSYAIDLTTSTEHEAYKNLLEKLYPAPFEQNVPMDAYRLAVQQLYSEKANLKSQYGSANSWVNFDVVFDNLMVTAYSLGKAPATVTVPEVEQAQARADEAKKQQQATAANWLKALSGVKKSNAAASQPAPAANAANNMTASAANSTVQTTPQTDVLGQVGDAAQKAGAAGDAANAAKKLFGL
jgi:hypothetical protein